jgi:hypothetical protein
MTTDERTRRLGWASLREGASFVVLLAFGVVAFAAEDGALGSTLEPVGDVLVAVFGVLFIAWLLALIVSTGRGVVQGWREGGRR